MAEDKDKKEEKKKKKEEKKEEHVCTLCGRPSPMTICHACEDKIRGEVLEHQHEINKAGRTDTGRR
jgi:recombinational DNA repair protein RecR